jgi:hypothetical protein
MVRPAASNRVTRVLEGGPFLASTTLRTVTSWRASDTRIPLGSGSHSFVLSSTLEKTNVLGGPSA